MPNYRIDRVTEDIRREVMASIRELKDPRVNDNFISVVRVELTRDMSFCTVYVSSLGGLDKTEIAVKGLKSASGYIRSEIGKKLKIRHVPEFIFKATDSIEYGASISKIINDLNKE